MQRPARVVDGDEQVTAVGGERGAADLAVVFVATRALRTANGYSPVINGVEDIAAAAGGD